MSEKFRTPILGNTSEKDFDHVYEPAEDSFLMLDILEKEDKFLQSLEPSICLEIGCGSGICITFLAQMLENPAVFFCTDINPHAVYMSQQTAERNKQMVEPVLCHLADSFKDRLRGNVDILLFNPPYVVTPSEEVKSDGIASSWAGGLKGREVTDQLLPQIDLLLSLKGVFYLVVIKENDTDDIRQIMLKQGFSMTCVGSRRAGREFLSVFKFERVIKSSNHNELSIT